MRTNAVLLLAFLSLASGSSYAQSTLAPLLRLTILPSSGAAEPQLESVLRGTIELALSQGPFIALFPGDPGMGGQEPELELKILYTMRSSRVSLSISFRDKSGTLPPRDEALERELDPQFDQAVAAMVSSVLREGAELFGSRPALSLEAAAQSTQGASEASAVTGQEAPEPEPEPLPQAAVDPTLRQPKPPSSFEAGLGAMLPLGEASAYFIAAPRLHARYSRYLDEGKKWSLGVAGSSTGFAVSGESQARAISFFMLLGGDLGYSFRPDKRFDPWVSTGGGPALVIAGSAGESLLIKVVPYYSLGFGADIGLSRNLGLGLGISLSLLFDYGRGSSYLLMGLNPSLAARLEL